MNSINNCQIKSKITYIFFFNFFFFKNLLCQINDNYFSGDLDSADYFLDVKDNNNLYLIITSSKKYMLEFLLLKNLHLNQILIIIVLLQHIIMILY